MPSINLNFTQNKIIGDGVDPAGKYEISGLIKGYNQENNKQNIKMTNNKSFFCTWMKKYEIHENNFGNTFRLTLLASKIPNSNLPGFLGKYSEPLKKTEGIWYILPKFIECEPKNFLKLKYSKRLLVVFFTLGIFNFVNLILWLINICTFDYSYNHYANYVVGYQWHGILSFLAVIYIYKNRNILKTNFDRSIDNMVFKIKSYVFCIIVITMAFGIIDMISGDFLLNNRNEKWSENCGLMRKACSVVWSANYLDCPPPGLKKYICFTFESEMNENCETKKFNLATNLLLSSIFSLVILGLWILLISIYFWVQRNEAFVLRKSFYHLNNGKKLNDQNREALIALIN